MSPPPIYNVTGAETRNCARAPVSPEAHPVADQEPKRTRAESWIEAQAKQILLRKDSYQDYL